MFASMTSRSTSSAGVSSAYLLRPTGVCKTSVRVSMPQSSLRARTRTLEPCCPVGVFDETQRFQVVDRAGLERCAGFEAIDEMRDDTVEARLIARIGVVALAARVRSMQAELRVRERGARPGADHFQMIRRARRVATRRHRARHLDWRAGGCLKENSGDRLAHHV